MSEMQNKDNTKNPGKPNEVPGRLENIEDYQTAIINLRRSLDMNSNDKLIMLYLLVHHQFSTAEIAITDDEFSIECGMSIQVVKRSVKRLKSLELIQVIRPNNVRTIKIGVSKLILRSINIDTSKYQKRYLEVLKMIPRSINIDTLVPEKSKPTPIYIKENIIKESSEVLVSKNLFGDLQKIPLPFDGDLHPSNKAAELVAEVNNPKQKIIEYPPDLISALKDFAEMRKASKKPLTDGAKKRVMKKLILGTTHKGIFYLVDNTADQIAAVDLCIERNWLGIEFGIKTIAENKKKSQSDSINLDKPFTKLPADFGGRIVNPQN